MAANSFVPEGVLLLIFSRLPAKSLLRFRCVSKGIRSLIDSPLLVKEHLDQSLEKRSDFDIIIARDPAGNYADVFSLDFYGLNSAQATGLDCPIKDAFGSAVRALKLVGTCNGILCLANCLDLLGFLLWNPSTGKFWKIETSFRYDYHDIYYFGYNDVQKDYVLVRFPQANIYNQGSEVYRLGVYRFRTKKWETIKINSISPIPVLFTFFHNGGVFVRGAIHWLAGSDKAGGPTYISALDLQREEFRTVPLPQLPPPGDGDEGPVVSLGSLGELGGRLCVIYFKKSERPQYSLWVMRKYGIQESWTPLFTVNCPGALLQYPITYSKCRRSVLARFENGYSLKWCHLEEGTQNPSEVRIFGTPDDGWGDGPLLPSMDACVCLRTLVQL